LIKTISFFSEQTEIEQQRAEQKQRRKGKRKFDTNSESTIFFGAIFGAKFEKNLSLITFCRLRIVPNSHTIKGKNPIT
jgi:hypothetical protein